MIYLNYLGIHRFLLFGKSVLLKKTRIYLLPLTANDNVPARKCDLLEKLKSKIPDLDKVQEKCKEAKLFSVDICFYLNKNPKSEGESKKDLDNMMKPLLDVLAHKITISNNELVDGLGLIGDDNLIHEIHCVKRLVDEKNIGLEIEISSWKEKSS